jgi:hypothetical protein
LLNAAGAVLLEMKYEDDGPWPFAPDGLGHSLVLKHGSYGERDPRAWDASVLRGGSPGAPEPSPAKDYAGLVINEFLAHTDLPQVDFVELYNGGADTLDISGCILSDHKTMNSFVVPSGTTIAPRGFIHFSPPQLPFRLSAYGEQVVLKTPDDSRVIDAVGFAGQLNGVSMGRYPDGGEGFFELASPTPSQTNALLRRPTVVINEIMFNPSSGRGDEEYVELYNTSDSPMDVSGWAFTEGIDFFMPEGTMIPAHGFLVVAKDAARLRSLYPHLNAQNTVGNYAGLLSNYGEQVVLSCLDDPGDAEEAWVIVDQIHYRDGGNWCHWADGDGSSLERINPDMPGRFAANWTDSDEREKSAWVSCVMTGRLVNGMLPSGSVFDRVDLLLTREGECLLDDIMVHLTGGPNLCVNPGFEDGVSGWEMHGNHGEAEVVFGDATSGSRALRLVASGGGDTRANRVSGMLSQVLPSGQEVVLSCKAKRLRGDGQLMLRTAGNYAYALFTLPDAAPGGTPALVNSCYSENAAPAIYGVHHDPALPELNEPVTVRARAYHPDGLGTVRLFHRVDPSGTWVQQTMTNDGDGFFSAIIPGQSAEHTVAFYVSATDAGMAQNAVYPAAAPERECLVRFGAGANHGSIAQYHVWLTQAGINTWSNQCPLSNRLIPATFVCGERIIYQAGVRYRGSSFLRTYEDLVDPATAYAPGYRVGFPKDQCFLGRDEINLDWMEVGRDPSYQRERTSHWMAEHIGIPSAYQRYVHVVLHGRKRGFIYTDSQHIDSDYLASWFPGVEQGDLHKINDWVEYKNDLCLTNFVFRDASLQRYALPGGASDEKPHRWSWEKKPFNGYDPSMSNLLVLVEAMNSESAVYQRAVESQVDVRQWMRVFALRHVIGDWDSFGYRRGKNMFAFKPKDGRWQLLNWDMDFGLGVEGGHPATHNLFDVAPEMPTIQRMMQYPPFRRIYMQSLLELYDGPMVGDELDELVTGLHDGLCAEGVSVESPAPALQWIEQRRTFMRQHLQSFTNAAFRLSGIQSNAQNNGAVVYGSAPVQVYEVRMNGRSAPLVWSSPTAWRMDTALSNGWNDLVIEGFDGDGQPLPGMSVSTSIYCAASSGSMVDDIMFSELMYHSPVAGAEYIELQNTSTNTIYDLAGCRIEGALEFTFAGSTLIPPGGCLVLARNATVFHAAYGADIPVAASFGHALPVSGGTLRLIGPCELEKNIISQMRWSSEQPWPQEANGQGAALQLVDARREAGCIGNWAADSITPYTPGRANSVAGSRPAFPALTINEVQPHNTGMLADAQGEYDPWIELHNAGTDPIDLSGWYLTDDAELERRWTFPDGSIITGGQFLVVWMDGQADQTSPAELHASFRLSASGGLVILAGEHESVPFALDYVDCSSVAPDRSLGASPDGSTNRMVFVYPTPGAANNAELPLPRIRINEWMASNTKGIINPTTGNRDDWFELYNAEDYPVNIAGYRLTDHLADTGKFVIDSPVILAPGEFRLVWCGDEDVSANTWGTNDLHAPFGLKKDGEQIGIFNPQGILVDAVSFGAQSSDVSQGCYPDGDHANTRFFQRSTPRRSNLLSDSGAVTIHEVPIQWLEQHGWTSDFEQHALADHDGDSMATWQEYVAGTDPTDKGSIFSVESHVDGTRHSGNTLTWAPGVPGRTYIIQNAPSLDRPFTNVATVTYPATSLVYDASADVGYYRIQVILP